MTFVVAYAGPRVAFVAGDTRGELRHWRPDIGGFGPAVQQFRARKLAPLPHANWLLQTGWPLDWGTLLRSARIGTLRDRVPLPAVMPESAFAAQARVWAIAPSGEGFRLEQWNWWTGAVADATGLILSIAPGDWPGPPPELYRRVGERLAPALQRAGRAAVVEVVRGIVELFAHVHETLSAEGSVSADCEIGVLSRERGRVWSEHLGPTRAATIATRTDAQLVGAFMPMNPSAAVGHIAQGLRGLWAGTRRRLHALAR